MKRFLMFFVVLIPMLMLAGCGERVTINSGEKGKQLTTSGLENDIRDPGSFRMNMCLFTACPRLIRIQTAMSAHTISIDKVFLPKSNVTLDNVTFGIQFRVKEDKKSINAAFSTIRAVPDTEVRDSNDRVITSEMIFKTYIERKVPEIVIAAMRNYTIDEALSNVTEISAFVRNTINKELADTPIEVTEFGFPNGTGTPPQVVLDAKEKLYTVDEDRARRVRELDAALSIEAQRQKVQQTRAANDALIAEQLNMTIQEFMILKTLERFADASENGTPVAIGGQFIPMCPTTNSTRQVSK